MKELIKLAVVLGGYFVLAPLAGYALAKNRAWERGALCLLVFMTSWFPSKLTLMLGSVEWYRGHTKGFEFSLLVAVGIALTVCGRVRSPAEPKRLPPGFWLYLAYCGVSCLSLLTATNRMFGLMAAWKFTSAVLIFVGAYSGFRDSKDLTWILRTLAMSLILQVGVCLKLRFVDGLWQVHGWFEHQNPLAMWAYLGAIPLLAVAFAPKLPARETWISLGGVAAAALIILLSVSRAALAAFVAGAVAVTALAYARGFSAKKLSLTLVGLAGAITAGLLALDSLSARVRETSAPRDAADLRAILNQQSRAMLQDSAVGVGWNNFGVANSLPEERYARILMDWDASRGFRLIDDNYFACPLTESLYWLLLAETGYPGMICYAVFLAATLWWGVRGLHRHWNSTLGYFIGGILIALALTYVHGSVERVLSQTKNLALWLVFAGLLARVEASRKSVRVSVPARRARSIVATPALPSPC